MVRHHQQWKSDKQRYARDFGDGDDSVDDSLMKVVQELLPCRGGDVDSLHDDNMMYLSDSLVSETAFNRGENLASREASSVSGLRPFSISGSLMEQKDYQATVRTPSKHSKNSGISSNGTRSKNGLKPFSLSPFKAIKKKGSKSSSIFDGITESGLGGRDTSGKFSVNSRGLSHVISRASTPLSLASQGPFLSPDSLSSVSGLSSTESRDYWSNRLRSGDSVGSIEKERKEKADSFWSYKPGKSATGFFPCLCMIIGIRLVQTTIPRAAMEVEVFHSMMVRYQMIKAHKTYTKGTTNPLPKNLLLNLHPLYCQGCPISYQETINT
jgi:hypothetical protein